MEIDGSIHNNLKKLIGDDDALAALNDIERVSVELDTALRFVTNCSIRARLWWNDGLWLVLRYFDRDEDPILIGRFALEGTHNGYPVAFYDVKAGMAFRAFGERSLNAHFDDLIVNPNSFLSTTIVNMMAQIRKGLYNVSRSHSV